MSFEALGLSKDILRAIADAGYVEPTPIQSKAIPVVLKGKDVIGIAQTGTGKTAAFVLPILEKLLHTEPKKDTRGVVIPRALVVTPTRELALQVFENVRLYAKHLPFRCAAVYGGVSEQPQIRTLREGTDIIVATPGRLLDLMSTLSANVREIGILVLDEADRMLDMGFIPDIRRIIRALPFDRQSLLFSATFPAEVETLSREFLTNAETVEIGRRATPTDTVTQFVYEVPPAKKTDLLVHVLKDENLDCVLVFTRTKIGADKVARALYNSGVPTALLHSNRSQNERLAALKGFKAGHYRVLVATDIAARGIDVDGISHVVNYDFPNHPEDYVHRIGRTGRAHAIGDALSFVTFEDLPELRALEKFLGRGIPRKDVEGLTIPAMPSDRDGGDGSAGRSRRRRGRPGGSAAPEPARTSSRPPSRGGRDRRERGEDSGSGGGNRRRGGSGEKRRSNGPAEGAPPAARPRTPEPARAPAAAPPAREPAPSPSSGDAVQFGRRSKKSRRR